MGGCAGSGKQAARPLDRWAGAAEVKRPKQNTVVGCERLPGLLAPLRACSATATATATATRAGGQPGAGLQVPALPKSPGHPQAAVLEAGPREVHRET